MNPKAYSKRTLWGIVAGLILLLLILVLSGQIPLAGIQKAWHYTKGKNAAQAGRWAEAFVHFDALYALDPAYRDADAQLSQAITEAQAVIPGGGDLDAERALLRRLAALADDKALAETLDRCTVSIPAGEFLMGVDENSPGEQGTAHERPQRTIYVDAFAIDRYEVSNVQYQRFVRESRAPAPPHWLEDTYRPGHADLPVVGVTWEQANAYCAWIGGRLPTEAEWEKACRGTDGRIYPWGDVWDPGKANVDPLGDHVELAEYVEPGLVGRGDDWAPVLVTPTSPNMPGLRPVGSYPEGASPYGVLDLAGNASEWMADWYTWEGYEAMPNRNPVGLGPEWNRAIRGSSWYPYGIAALAQDYSRCSARNSAHRGNPDARFGFRCVYPP